MSLAGCAWSRKVIPASPQKQLCESSWKPGVDITGLWAIQRFSCMKHKAKALNKRAFPSLVSRVIATSSCLVRSLYCTDRVGRCTHCELVDFQGAGGASWNPLVLWTDPWLAHQVSHCVAHNSFSLEEDVCWALVKAGSGGGGLEFQKAPVPYRTEWRGTAF